MLKPACNWKRPSKCWQLIQKGLLAAAVVIWDAAAAPEDSRGAPAAAAAAIASGERDTMVRFLEMMVAGKSSLAGNGQVSRLNVICMKGRHGRGKQRNTPQTQSALNILSHLEGFSCTAGSEGPKKGIMRSCLYGAH
jgi:hypothetical protein